MMISRRRRHSFQPCLDGLPSRIAPTVFVPPTDLTVIITTTDPIPVATPTTLVTTDDTTSVMTTPDCPH